MGAIKNTFREIKKNTQENKYYYERISYKYYITGNHHVLLKEKCQRNIFYYEIIIPLEIIFSHYGKIWLCLEFECPCSGYLPPCPFFEQQYFGSLLLGGKAPVTCLQPSCRPQLPCSYACVLVGCERGFRAISYWRGTSDWLCSFG